MLVCCIGAQAAEVVQVVHLVQMVQVVHVVQVVQDCKLGGPLPHLVDSRPRLPRLHAQSCPSPGAAKLACHLNMTKFSVQACSQIGHRFPAHSSSRRRSGSGSGGGSGSSSSSSSSRRGSARASASASGNVPDLSRQSVLNSLIPLMRRVHSCVYGVALQRHCSLGAVRF